MTTRNVIGGPVLLLVVAALAAGCGGGGRADKAAEATLPAATTPAAPVTTSRGAEALTAEAQQAAAGDVPDNQVFLTFHNTAEAYSIKYPEGWAQRGSAALVTFQDKNNLVRVEVAKGTDATVAGAR